LTGALIVPGPQIPEIALAIVNHYPIGVGSGFVELVMAEISSATGHGRRIRPVDVFIAGLSAAFVGMLAILAAIYIPLPAEANFGFRLGGFFFLAVGATAAALALLREEDTAQGR
jgi:hypothetical protein